MKKQQTPESIAPPEPPKLPLAAESLGDDWREKLRERQGEFVGRLLILSADSDSKIAFDSIKLLLELSGELKDDPASKAPVAPLFALPSNTEPSVLPHTPRKDLH